MNRVVIGAATLLVVVGLLLVVARAIMRLNVAGLGRPLPSPSSLLLPSLEPLLSPSPTSIIYSLPSATPGVLPSPSFYPQNPQSSPAKLPATGV